MVFKHILKTCSTVLQVDICVQFGIQHQEHIKKKVYVQYLAEWPGSFFSHRKHRVNTQCVFTSHFNIYMTTEMFKFKETFPE